MLSRIGLWSFRNTSGAGESTVSQSLKYLLCLWEANPPMMDDQATKLISAPAFDELLRLGILRPATLSAAFTCTECGERQPLDYLVDDKGTTRSFMCCSCGPVEVEEAQLRRWEFDSPHFLKTIFRSTKLSIEERVPGYLWKVGSAPWGGRPREIWFVRSFQSGIAEAVGQELKSRPRWILFTATEHSALQWQRFLPNIFISLESTVTFIDVEFHLDVELVVGRIVDTAVDSKARKPVPLRAVRAAKIERITDYMNDHLRAANELAWRTKELTGAPEFLPRPTQTKLADALGLTETDVSRCLDDKRAKELKVCWAIAENLDQIMRWTRPISRGRKRRTEKRTSK